MMHHWPVERIENREGIEPTISQVFALGLEASIVIFDYHNSYVLTGCQGQNGLHKVGV